MAKASKIPAERLNCWISQTPANYVPENPARNFREALQAMSLVGTVSVLSIPCITIPIGAAETSNSNPFFMRDIRNGTITMNQAMNMLAEVIGRWGTLIHIDTGFHKETHQITFAFNSVNLGGITPAGP
jgi:pyruvate-formate lyase